MRMHDHNIGLSRVDCRTGQYFLCEMKLCRIYEWTSVQPSKAEAVNIMLKPVCIDFSNVLYHARRISGGVGTLQMETEGI